MSFREDASDVVDALLRYQAESEAGQGRVVGIAPLGELIAELDLAGLSERGGLAGEPLRRFLERYLAGSTRLLHPGALAHQVAAPHPGGALAGLVGGFINNPMGIFEMGPSAVAVEAFVVQWMLSKIGWGQGGGGVLTHGGSLANLTALVAARTRLAPDVWRDGDPGDLALLAAPVAHYSIARAAGILGLGERHVYPLETGPDGTVLPGAVGPALRRARADGRRVMAVVASACCTPVGRFDPLRALGEACHAEGLWLHVDAAHGAAALLSERHRALLDGVALADSLTWDAHKLMRTAGLCTAVLVRDAATLDGAFHQEASYLFHEKHQPGPDLLHRTVECTKAELGLRFFLVLAALGERGLAAYVERQFALTHQAWRLIASRPGLECAVEPQANILCFRVPGDDARQLALRDRLLEEGRFHLSTTVFRGVRWLRLVVTSPTTELAHLEALVDRIEALGAGPLAAPSR
jgi:L-2,4-diaminobutyrate decarboxylase